MLWVHEKTKINPNLLFKSHFILNPHLHCMGLSLAWLMDKINVIRAQRELDCVFIELLDFWQKWPLTNVYQSPMGYKSHLPHMKVDFCIWNMVYFSLQGLELAMLLLENQPMSNAPSITFHYAGVKPRVTHQLWVASLQLVRG